MFDFNTFIDDEQKKIHSYIQTTEGRIEKVIRQEILKTFGFKPWMKVSYNDNEYTIRGFFHDKNGVFMELMYEEKVIFYYPNAPIEYETHIMRVNLNDFKLLEKVE